MILEAHTSPRVFLCALFMTGCAVDVYIARPHADAAVTDASNVWVVRGTINVRGGTSSTSGSVNELETTSDVTVSRGGVSIPGLRVSERMGSTAGALAVGTDEGRFHGEQHGFLPDITLDILDDSVHKVITFRAQEPQVIQSPASEQWYRANESMTVTWLPWGGASASISARGLPELPINDTGRFIVAPGTFPVTAGGESENRLLLRRAMQFVVSESDLDALFTVSITREVHFFVE